MTRPEGHPNLYEQLGAAVYDWGAPAVFLPLGGLKVLRERALDVLEIQRGISVLELGCGTGALTAMMLHRGVTVTAVDQSEAMLRRARRRAPAATFILSDLLDFNCDRKFDRVLLAFVLHHLEADARLATLKLARTALKPGGLVGVLDWAEPDNAILGWTLHAFLRAVEPSSAEDFIKQGMETYLEQAGLAHVRSRELGKGVAKVCVAASAT